MYLVFNEKNCAVPFLCRACPKVAKIYDNYLMFHFTEMSKSYDGGLGLQMTREALKRKNYPFLFIYFFLS